MKYIFIILVFCIIIFVYPAKNTKIELDDTELCPPSSYIASTSFFTFFLEMISDDFDSSYGQELIYIPAQEIEKRIPEYTLYHSNKYNPSVAHDIRGIAYANSTIGRPNGIRDIAWNVYAENKTPLVEKDPQSNYYRVYPYAGYKHSWTLVKSPPPDDGKGTPPEDWYIGHCLVLVGVYKCSIDLNYKTLRYNFGVYEHDLHLRDKIKLEIAGMFRDWEASCR